jgi:hypothetical protein
MQRTQILLALLLLVACGLAGCGHHAEAAVDDVGAVRRPNDIIEVTVTVGAHGQKDWPVDRELCVLVEWKESAKLSRTSTVARDSYNGSPDESVPAIDQAQHCATRAIKNGERASFKLSSTKPLPSSTPMTILAHLTNAGADRSKPPAPIVRDWVVRSPNP